MWRGRRRRHRRDALRGRRRRGRPRRRPSLYDRTDPLALAPFPDDYLIDRRRIDAERPRDRAAGRPLRRSRSRRRPSSRSSAQTVGVDGWSRMTSRGARVLASARPLGGAGGRGRIAGSVRTDRAGRRRPREPRIRASASRTGCWLRSDTAPDGSLDHVAMLFPSIDLREHGRYALVVTRRAFASGDPGRPFGPSPFFASVLAAPRPRARALEVDAGARHDRAGARYRRGARRRADSRRGRRARRAALDPHPAGRRRHRATSRSCALAVAAAGAGAADARRPLPEPDNFCIRLVVDARARDSRPRPIARSSAIPGC